MNAFECRSGSWFFSIVLLMSVFSFPAVRAATPGVAFSPAALNFGQLPCGQDSTQLLTVIYQRSMFPADHLPELRAYENSNTPVVTLFSRFDGPTTIRVVYRITVKSLGDAGPIHSLLALMRDKAVPVEDEATYAVEDNGVPVRGEYIQGLDVDSETIIFNHVTYGKGATQDFRVGAFRSNIVTKNEMIRRSTKPKAGDPPSSPALEDMTAASSSPYVVVSGGREMGLDGSSWLNWQIALSPSTPIGYLSAELVFTIRNGYSLTVPVRADVREAAVMEPDRTKKHSK